MIIDKQLEFSDAQALTATAASTNVIDLGYVGGNAGTGEPMFIAINAPVALAGTTPTFQVQVQQSVDNSTYVTVLESQEFDAFAAGQKLNLPVPATSARYIRLNYVLGGTTPTITVDAAIVQGEQAYTNYPDAL